VYVECRGSSGARSLAGDRPDASKRRGSAVARSQAPALRCWGVGQKHNRKANEVSPFCIDTPSVCNSDVIRVRCNSDVIRVRCNSDVIRVSCF
jgi:hypothetical protein